MTDKEALLRAILLNPTDDLPRAVFADWLEENGESERAEFVRVQVELATFPENSPDFRGPYYLVDHPHAVKFQSLRRREWELAYGLCFRSKVFAQLMPESEYHSVAVSPASPGLLNYDHRGEASRVTLAFSRGFVSEVRLPLAAFLAHAGSLFSAHPVTRVVLSDREPKYLVYGWGWFDGGEDASSLPNELWHENHGEPDDTRWVRANPADCLTALNLRCIAHGRHLTGLSPAPAEATT